MTADQAKRGQFLLKDIEMKETWLREIDIKFNNSKSKSSVDCYVDIFGIVIHEPEPEIIELSKKVIYWHKSTIEKSISISKIELENL